MSRELVIASLRGTATADMLAASDPRELVDIATRQGVAVIMRRELRLRFDLASIAPGLDSFLADAHERSLRRLMRQERAAAELRDVLRVPYLVWRGLHLAKTLYDDPSERAGADVDLLIAPAHRVEAIETLKAAGYRASVNEATASHELSFTGHGVHLDLHWQMMRPQRSRSELGAWLFARAVEHDGMPVPDATATAVMLVLHTALTEHITGRLIRAVDLDRLLRRTDVDWQVVVDVIARSGLKSGGWATLKWTQSLFDTPIDAAVLSALAPSRARQRYLLAWVAAGPAGLYDRAPLLVRGAFSLALQDHPRDAARALLGLLRARLDLWTLHS